jgi:hypothetical protein
VRFVDESGRSLAIDWSGCLGISDPAGEFAGWLPGGTGSEAEIHGLPRGRLTLYVAPGTSGRPYLSVSMPVDVPSAEPVTVVLVRGGEVEGMVVGADGRPLVDVSVCGYPEGARLVRGDWPDGASETGTDATGRFHIERLKPGVRYTVVVEGDDRSPYGVAAVAGVAAGTKDLRFALVRGRTVTGHLVDVAGKPVEEATLAVLDNRGLPVAWAQTQDGGAFSMRGVPDRAVQVVARFEDTKTPDQVAGTIPVGAAEVSLRLPTALPPVRGR